jgi:protein-disulfide isomerase-like protein with CxxC motif
MPELVRFHFDPRCPWCWQTSHWARQLQRLGEITLEWGVFSLEIVNAAEGTDVSTLEAVSGPALRTAIAIRDAEGRQAIGPFYEALGQRLWHEPPPPGPDEMVEAVTAALGRAGLDPSLCEKALADPGTWLAVVEEHREVIDRHGAFGVPTIVLDGGQGPAIFGPVVAELPSDADAIDLWRHTSWLVRYDNFYELKRHRPKPPDLPVMEYMREQRRKAKEAEAKEAEAKGV